MCPLRSPPPLQSLLGRYALGPGPWHTGMQQSTPSSRPAAITASIVAAMYAMARARLIKLVGCFYATVVCGGHSVGEPPMPSKSPSSLSSCHTHSRFFATWLKPKDKLEYIKQQGRRLEGWVAERWSAVRSLMTSSLVAEIRTWCILLLGVYRRESERARENKRLKTEEGPKEKLPMHLFICDPLVVFYLPWSSAWS